jgi:YD repeat-containing protein
LIPYSKMQTNASTAKKNTHPIWSVKSFGILIASLMLMTFGLWGVFSPSPQQTTPSQQTTIVYQSQPVAKKYITKNIEDIQKGDLVYAYDVTTCEVSLKEVTDAFIRTSDHLRYLTTTSKNDVAQTFETTDAHPFWVVTNNPDLERVTRNVVIENGTVLGHENIPITEHGYYVEAKDLNVGDVFIGANDEQTTLTATSRKEFPNGITVYNFSFEDNHNYYVIANLEAYENGAGVVLVHNAEYTGSYLAKKAPFQVTPGTKVLQGQYVDDLGRVQPWKAYYDDFGRLIGRTDYNAGNLSQGIPNIHHHTYEWGPGRTPSKTGSHIPGEYHP